MAAQLIVNADDFGLTPGINRAVGELAAVGAVTSATLMATGPAFADAVAIAKAHPQLGVGCHVVLCDGTPMLHAHAIPSLLGADGKSFRFTLKEFHYALWRGMISEHELIREIGAQVQKLQRAGIRVTHMDSHKHTHVAPAVARAMLFVAERTGVPAIRNPFEPSFVPRAGGLRRRVEVAAMRHFAPRFLALDEVRKEEVATTGGTLGISATGSLDERSLRELLQSVPENGVWELMVHPGHNDAALDRITTRLRSSREEECVALARVLAKQSSRPTGIELTNFGQLGRAGVLRSLGQQTVPTGYETVL